MGFLELLLLSVSLAMDAFAVSICGSMVLSPADRTGGALRFGVWFGFFQFLMPIIGYFGAISFIDYITAYEHLLAFALLLYLGVNMIREAKEACSIKHSYTTKEMAVLAIATSIDALAVGISLAFLNTNIWLASSMIGVVTFAIATFGGLAGFRLGSAVGKNANIIGGLVLIAIGVKIVLEHTGIIS